MSDAVWLIPTFTTSMEGGYGVSVNLPNSYRDRIGGMAGREKFRRGVETGIAEILSGTLDEVGVRVIWDSRAPFFRVDEGDACEVGIEGSDYHMKRYTSHNVDSSKQALALLTCLNIFMRSTLIYLGVDDAEACKKDAASNLLGLYEVGQFIPEFVPGERGHGVGVKVPESYGRWIGKMSGNSAFRNMTEDMIATILRGTLKNSFVDINWKGDGPTFRVRGDACEAIIEGSGRELTEYSCYNVDTGQQALTLLTCLGIHLRNTLNYLGIITERPDSYSNLQDPDRVFYTRLDFDEEGNPTMRRDYKIVEFQKRP